MDSFAAPARLSRIERLGVALLAVALIAFGVIVEWRSAYQNVRHTDFGVYARAAWAVHTGADLYAIEDDRGWHYCYPPPFAVAMIPFADPPAGEPRAGYLPFAVSVALWYGFSVACAAFAVHRLALAILPEEPRYSRRWWYARTGPFTVALGAIGHTLARGQVNLLVVALVVGMFTELVRRRSFAAGLWLGAAACIKVIPAFLVLYFLLKRDRRGLLGTAAAVAIGLGALPAAVVGPQRAFEWNRTFVLTVLQPGTTGHGDRNRALELTNATATDSQSFQSTLHNWLHADRASRPANASGTTRLAHWSLAGLATLAILVALRGRPANPVDVLLALGALGTAMLHVTPVSHMHYYAYALPLVCGVWLKGLRDHPDRAAPAGIAFLTLVVWGTVTGAALFAHPIADNLRHFGAGLAASYLLVRAALARPIQSRISGDWPSRSPRISASAAAFTRSAP